MNLPVDHGHFSYDTKLTNYRKQRGANICANYVSPYTTLYRSHMIQEVEQQNSRLQYLTMTVINRLPIYLNYIPIVLVLHHSTAQETLLQGRLQGLYSLKNRSKHTWTPQTTILRVTDLNDLLLFCDLFLVTGARSTEPRISAPSTAACNPPHRAITTICNAVDIVRRLDGTGQAQKLAGSCLENGEPGLRVDRCHLLTIH
jgi:hypothetical protein